MIRNWRRAWGLGVLVVAVACSFGAQPSWSQTTVANWEIVNRDGRIGVNVSCQISNCGANYRVRRINIVAGTDGTEYEVGNFSGGRGAQCQSVLSSSTLGYEDTDVNLVPLGTYEFTCRFIYTFQRSAPGGGTEGSSGRWEASGTINHPGPPSAPLLRLVDSVATDDQVWVNISYASASGLEFDPNSSLSGYAEPTGFQIWRKNGDNGTWHVIQQEAPYVAADEEAQLYIDQAPLAGRIWYGVRQRNIYTDLTGTWGDRAEDYLIILPVDIDGPPRNLAAHAAEGGWTLTWDPPARARVFGIKTYRVFGGPIADGEPAWLWTLNASPTPSFLFRRLTKGVVYTFHVIANRDQSNSPPSESIVYGTETAPTPFEENSGMGWVRIGWHAGPYNGNGLPRSDISWSVRHRLASLSGEGDDVGWVVTPNYGNNNVRSIALNVNNSSVRDVGAAYDAATYEVQVAAINPAGVGVWGTVTTSAIAPLRGAPASGRSQEVPFGPDRDDLAWQLEGPTEISPGDTAIYVLRASLRPGASRTTPPSADDRSVRPVGIREIYVAGEPEVNNREIRQLESANDSCNVSGAHRLCLSVADVEDKINHVGWAHPDGADEAYAAYQPDSNGVPHGHRMEVRVRNYSIYPLIGRQFKVGLGIRDGGVMVFREDMSRGCSSGCDDRFMVVTIVRADPLPPTNLRLVSNTRPDSTPIWTVVWEPPRNAAAAQVDDTDYRVYRRVIGTAQFAVVEQEIRRARMEWIKANTPAAFEVYVVAVSGPTGSRMESEPSATLRIGFPLPPHPVRAAGGDGLVTVTWDPPSNPTMTITGYRVEWSSDGTTNWNEVATVAADTSRVEHSGRGVLETSYYRVVTKVAGAESAPSTVESATTTVPALILASAPTSLVAQAAARDRIVISWEPPTDALEAEVDRYQVERSAGGTPTDLWEVVNDQVTATHYIDTALAAGATWYYRVAAIGGRDQPGASSAVVSAATIQAGAPDAPPRLLTAWSEDGSSVTLSWLAPPLADSELLGYRIEQAAMDTVVWTVLVENTGNVNTAFTHSPVSLGPGETISYRVSGVNAVGPGVPVSTDATTQAANFDFTHANFNADGVVDPSDAAILYYALTYPELLGDGTASASDLANLRQTLLMDHLGNNQANVAGYRLLVSNALQWHTSHGLENGGDLNQDGVVGADDAIIWYYAQSFGTQLGLGDAASGSAAMRRVFLGHLAGGFDGSNDTVLRGLIIHARAIALP